MKKTLSLIIMIISVSSLTFGQGSLEKGEKQLNAGFGFAGRGNTVFAGLDFLVIENLSAGPMVGIWFNSSSGFITGSPNTTVYTQVGFEFGVNVDYHFNSLIPNLPKEVDIYAGGTASFIAWTNTEFGGAHASTFAPRGHVGGRYFFTDKFGVNAQVNVGYSNGAKAGITYKF